MYENTAFFTYIWQIQKQTETQFIPHKQKYPEKVRLGIKTKAKHEISNPSVYLMSVHLLKQLER